MVAIVVVLQLNSLWWTSNPNLKDVTITKVDPVGNYAIQPYFDDGHDTGIYSWETLYDLGNNRDAYWADYLARLEAAGHKHRGSLD